MAKIILGQRPKSFVRTVHFQQVDGSPGQIDVTYIYRTRSEFGKFADEIRAQVKAKSEAEVAELKGLLDKKLPIPDLTQSDIIERESATNVSYVTGCIEGWNLDVPFDAAAVAQLADEVPAAVTAIISTYRDAITEGRSGN